MGLTKDTNDEPGYLKHVFVCGHERPEGAQRPHCSGRGSLQLLSQLKALSREAGIEKVRIQKSGCLDYCEHGISCVVYPEGVWYTLQGEADLPSIIEHVRGGKIAGHLLMKLDG
ncbi:MAG: (2Fe-2S) ferredoxin domain-containing protein [Candidatus Poseidoniales archaeon]|jgi:(2Fe-2S) ferredoxin